MGRGMAEGLHDNFIAVAHMVPGHIVNMQQEFTIGGLKQNPLVNSSRQGIGYFAGMDMNICTAGFGGLESGNGEL